MRDGTCVKCEAQDVYFVDSAGGAYADLNLGWSGGPFSGFYVCGRCGFTERYVHADHLHRLVKKGKRVPPTSK